MSNRRMKCGIVVLACLGVMAGTVAAATDGRVTDKLKAAGASHRTTAANRRLAIRDANTLLAGVTPPAGSTVRASGKGVGLHARLLTTAFASAVAYRTWKAPGNASSVLSFVEAHLPKGSKVFSSGAGGPSPTFQSVTLAWPPVKGRLEVRWLQIDVTSAGSNKTLLHAESQSQWLVVRLANELIPAGVREVDVTRAWPGKPPLLSRSVTNRNKVHSLVALFNSLGVIQPGTTSCPGETLSPVVTVEFRRASTDTPVAAASVSAAADYSWPAGVPGWACYPIGFTVRGHSRTPLVGNVITPIERLLGVRLAYHPALPSPAGVAAAHGMRSGG